MPEVASVSLIPNRLNYEHGFSAGGFIASAILMNSLM
jgi:hypothetical protein